MKWLNRRIVLLATPAVICFLLLYVLPFGGSIYYSVTRSPFDHSFVRLENYASVWTNRYFQLAMLNTGRFSLLAVPCMLGLSLFLSMIFFELHPPHQLMGAYVLPVLLPTACVVPIFRALFDSYYGALKPAFECIGLTGALMPEISLFAMYLWKNLGVAIIMITAALSQVPASLYEAAWLDGANCVRRHVYISLPQIIPAVFFVGVLSLVYSLRVFREAYLLYGTYPPSRVYLLQHYMNNHFYKLNYQNLTTAAISFALMLCVLLIPTFRFVQKRGEAP